MANKTEEVKESPETEAEGQSQEEPQQEPQEEPQEEPGEGQSQGDPESPTEPSLSPIDPRVQEILRQSTGQAYQQGQQEAESRRRVEADQERLAQMSDEDYGREVREQQRRNEAGQALQNQALQGIIGALWQRVEQRPDYKGLSAPEQQEVHQTFWQGGPDTAVDKLYELRDHKAQAKTQAEADHNKEVAEQHRKAQTPPEGQTEAGPQGPSEDSSWEDIWAAKDKLLGRKPRE
jgi:hypothetical protein